MNLTLRNEAATQWILGDKSTAASIAASKNLISMPSDCRRLNWDSSTVVVVITGSGTAKLTVEGSRNGVDDYFSCGDLITGMVVGTGKYILKLSNTSLAYFHFLRFTVTETGGSASVAVKVFLNGQML